jgi:glycosyltransferase involved in cell wall biosynthesis
VCLSHDGVKKLKKIFPDKKILRIPHVIDFDHFSTTTVDKAAVRKSMGIPEDCFLVTMVYNLSESTSRKTPEIALSAFKIFNKKHPNSRLYIHSKLEHGVDVNEIIDYLDMRHLIIASDQAKMAKGGYTFDFVVNLMKVSDVLFNATASEGYCLPIMEANAVGTAAIGANSTAMPDNLYNGELCKIYQKKFCLQNTSYWFLPDAQDCARCIEKIYLRTPEERRKMTRYGMKCIRENSNLKTLYDAWKPLLA